MRTRVDVNVFPFQVNFQLKSPFFFYFDFFFWNLGTLCDIVCDQVMDDRWDERVKEYGAINITGFRIIDTERPIVQQFFRTWEALDPAIYPGAGKPFIPVKFWPIL